MTDLSAKTTRELLTTEMKPYGRSVAGFIEYNSTFITGKFLERINAAIARDERLTRIVAAVREYCQGYSGKNNNMNDAEWGSANVADAVLEIINQEPSE